MSKAPNSPSTRDVLARSLVQIKQLRAQIDELQKAQQRVRKPIVPPRKRQRLRIWTTNRPADGPGGALHLDRQSGHLLRIERDHHAQ